MTHESQGCSNNLQKQCHMNHKVVKADCRKLDISYVPTSSKASDYVVK